MEAATALLTTGATMRNHYPILTIEQHEAAIAECKASEGKRYDSLRDDLDGCVSSWANSSMITYHRAAIALLEAGAAAGLSGPGVAVTVLLIGGERVDAEQVIDSYGNPQWKLSQDAAERIGRRYVPAGGTSRVQKQLGLSEAVRVVPAARHLKAECAFVGSPVYFTGLPE